MKAEPNFTPDEVRALSLQVIRECPFPVLASTAGDQPRVRPVSPLRSDGFTIYVASMRSSEKTHELESNPKVELCYLAPNHDQVRITGLVEVVDSADPIRREVWDSSPLLRAYLTVIDNPEFVLYRVIPSRVRFMREWALLYHDVRIAATQ